MPTSYQIDTAVRVIFSKAEGLLTDEDLLAHQNQLREDPAFNWSFDQIYDFREASEVRVTSDTVQDLLRARLYEKGIEEGVRGGWRPPVRHGANDADPS